MNYFFSSYSSTVWLSLVFLKDSVICLLIILPFFIRRFRFAFNYFLFYDLFYSSKSKLKIKSRTSYLPHWFIYNRCHFSEDNRCAINDTILDSTWIFQNAFWSIYTILLTGLLLLNVYDKFMKLKFTVIKQDKTSSENETKIELLTQTI
jgi:hypothetical protein